MQFESPCPSYTEDLTVLTEGCGERPVVLHRGPAEVGGGPEGSGRDAGSRVGEMLNSERCPAERPMGTCVSSVRVVIRVKSLSQDLAGSPL